MKNDITTKPLTIDNVIDGINAVYIDTCDLNVSTLSDNWITSSGINTWDDCTITMPREAYNKRSLKVLLAEAFINGNINSKEDLKQNFERIDSGDEKTIKLIEAMLDKIHKI